MRTFRTEDRKLFDFLDLRGHTNWRMRNINSVYVAFFSDSKRLQGDIAVYKRTRSTASDSGIIRTLDQLAAVWARGGLARGPHAALVPDRSALHPSFPWPARLCFQTNKLSIKVNIPNQRIAPKRHDVR